MCSPISNLRLYVCSCVRVLWSPDCGRDCQLKAWKNGHKQACPGQLKAKPKEATPTSTASTSGSTSVSTTASTTDPHGQHVCAECGEAGNKACSKCSEVYCTPSFSFFFVLLFFFFVLHTDGVRVQTHRILSMRCCVVCSPIGNLRPYVCSCVHVFVCCGQDCGRDCQLKAWKTGHKQACPGQTKTKPETAD